MTNKLTLNEEIQSFLNTDDKDLWTLILEDKTDDIKSLSKEDNDLYQIVIELIFEGKSQVLDGYDFWEIKEGNNSLFRDMVRLILALDINGRHEELRLYVVDKLFDSIPDIVKNIKEQAKGYPRNPINALVWSEGAGFRSGLNALIYYYKLKDDDSDTLHFLIMNRTQITLSIMGHYKNLVGPDMIESAKMKERLGDTDAALSFYKAIEADFKNELTWFIHSPETGPNEEDVITLESLKEALKAIDRLSNRNEYLSVCEQIDEVLSREHIEIPDFDEEEDE